MPERNNTNFLRVVAIIFIVNSHMDSLYPQQFAFLATGGMIGNALFFMLSGYGLLVSMQARSRAFGPWYGRRIIRIYPSVWVAVILLIFPIGMHNGSIRLDNSLEVMSKFFYPPFWFLQALMIYYGVIFFLIRDFSYKRLTLISIPIVTTYVLYYIFLLDLAKWSVEESPFKLIFYILVVLWGLYLGSKTGGMEFRGPRDFFFLLLSILVIYCHKYLMQRGYFMSFQFVQQLASFPMLYFFVKVSNSHFITHTVMDNGFVGKAFTFVSCATLEIFIVNNSLTPLASKLGAFPFNLIALVSLNVGLSFAIFYCAKFIRRSLEADA